MLRACSRLLLQHNSVTLRAPAVRSCVPAALSPHAPQYSTSNGSGASKRKAKQSHIIPTESVSGDATLTPPRNRSGTAAATSTVSKADAPGEQPNDKTSIVQPPYEFTEEKTGMDQFFEDRALKKTLRGDPWTVRILRGKSFEDLHKLWYILLKERNLLLTHIHFEFKNNLTAKYYTMRLGNVKSSMKAIKQVIHERELALNKAISLYGAPAKKSMIAKQLEKYHETQQALEPLITDTTRITLRKVKALERPNAVAATRQALSDLELVRQAMAGATSAKRSMQATLKEAAASLTVQHLRNGQPLPALASTNAGAAKQTQSKTRKAANTPPPIVLPNEFDSRAFLRQLYDKSAAKVRKELRLARASSDDEKAPRSVRQVLLKRRADRTKIDFNN